jgi:hypothetical protein
MSSYLLFETRQPEQGRKTLIVDVKSVSRGDTLGEIRWYSHWRQYCFWPRAGTIWNRDCMTEVQAEISHLMEARKQ